VKKFKVVADIFEAHIPILNEALQILGVSEVCVGNTCFKGLLCAATTLSVSCEKI
jgi:hypothetical protein